MTWLENIECKDLQFENAKLEEQVRNWVASEKGKEVFAGLLIKVPLKGNRNYIVSRIYDVIPFPNNSKTPEHSAFPNEEWFKIMAEKRSFDSIKFYDFSGEMIWLGWMHSHPNEKKPQFSDADMRFMGWLATTSCHWNDHFALLVSHSKKKTFRYDVKFATYDRTPNDSHTKPVTFRSYFQWPWAI